MNNLFNIDDENNDRNVIVLMNRIGFFTLILTISCIICIVVVFCNNVITLRKIVYSLTVSSLVQVIPWLWFGYMSLFVKPIEYKQLRIGKRCVLVSLIIMYVFWVLGGLYITSGYGIVKP